MKPDPQLVKEVLADLEIQAMIFDMDIDYETLTLIPKPKHDKEPFWLTRWKEKRDESDADAGHPSQNLG